MNAHEIVKKCLPEAEQFKPGDKVSFTSRRNQLVTGVVTRLRVKEKRKAQRLLAMHGLSDPYGLTQDLVAEVAPDTGEGVWTVPVRMLKLVKGGGDLNAARSKVASIRNAYQDRLDQRKSDRYDKAETGGLYDLKPGDLVKCQFKGGAQLTRKFKRITPSGKVEVETDYGRLEKHNPQFVKRADS
jgi:hypothetical protein